MKQKKIENIPFGFGITELDQLFNNSRNFAVSQWSGAITGGNGSGKSILALHIAANYIFSARKLTEDKGFSGKTLILPRVIYVSSDLSFEQATQIWTGFGLNHMQARQDILKAAYEEFKGQRDILYQMVEQDVFRKGQINLIDIDPLRTSEIETLLKNKAKEATSQEPLTDQIFFLNLQKNTTGDDWAFLNSLTGLLHRASTEGSSEHSAAGTRIPDLIIIDAVEGLQTISGDIDQYGEGRSRRSRVAQLARNCTSTCTNLLFVIEKECDNIREPEQFITDYVFSLRTKYDSDYVQRSIEIEKFRGCAHARGEHEIMFRTGKGTFSGDESHIDDPRITWVPQYVKNVIDSNKKSEILNEIQSSNPHYLRKVFEGVPKQNSLDSGSNVATHENRQATFAFDQPPEEVHYLAHVKVMESVHYWNAKFREEHYQLPLEQLPPTFGVELLDSLLGKPPSWTSDTNQNSTEIPANPSRNIESGSPFNESATQERSKSTGSVTLFLGDAGTPKSKLARRFLSRALISSKLIEENSATAQPIQKPNSKVNRFDEEGIAIYFTTDMTDKNSVIDQLSEHIAQDEYEPGSSVDQLTQYSNFAAKKSQIKDRMEAIEIDPSTSRLFVRRLSARRLTTAYLLSVVKKQLEWAVGQLENINKELPAGKKIPSSNIRFVIDDWSQLVETHPNLAQDPLFLQSLLALIRSKGVMAIFVSTQPGKPYLPPIDNNPSDLRRIDEQQVYFWNVSFHGERRTAITCLIDKKGEFDPEIYEIRNFEKSNDCVIVSREFGFYSGLESGEARRVPLEVRLVGFSDKMHRISNVAFPTYYKQAADLLENLFASPEGKVLQVHNTDDYESQAILADWTDGSPQGKTMVIQVDEFWNCRPGMLMNLERYWKRDVVAKWNKTLKRYAPQSNNSQTDVYVLWQTLDQPDDALAGSIDRPEHWWQDLLLHREPHADDASPPDVIHRCNLSVSDNHPYQEIDRIPLYWDFGFIVADRRLWESCANSHVRDLCGSSIYLHEIWDSLCLEDDYIKASKGCQRIPRKPVDWLAFISACHLISRQHPGTIPFDLESDSSESIICLLLEIWASVAQFNKMEDTSNTFQQLSLRKPPENSSGSGHPNQDCLNLRYLIENHPTSLYIACALTAQALNHIQGTHDRGTQRVTTSERFVASRQYYSTASPLLVRSIESKHQLCSLRLPGSYSVRGDWYLSVPNGSRSWLLAERCIDILCSRRMNLLRLIDGIGLPVRDIVHVSQMDNIATSLLRWNEEIGRPESLTYKEIKALGKADAKHIQSENDFHWLWRSSIGNYSREAFYLRRWVGRMLFDKRKWLNRGISSGFEQLLIDFFHQCERHGSRGSSSKPIRTLEDFSSMFSGIGDLDNKKDAEYFWRMKMTLHSALRKYTSA